MNEFLAEAVPGLLAGLSLIVAIGAQNAYLLRVGICAPRRTVIVAASICALSDMALIAAGVAGLGVLVERFPGAIAAVTAFGIVFLAAYGLFALRRVFRPQGMDVGPVGPEAGPAHSASRETADANPRNRGFEVGASLARTASGTHSGGTETTLASRTTPAADHAGSSPHTDAAHSASSRTIAGASLAATAATMAAFTWLNPHVYLDTVLLLGSIANAHAHPWRWAAGAMGASVLWFFGLGFGARLLRPLFARPRAWQVLDLLIALTMFAIAAKLAAGLA